MYLLRGQRYSVLMQHSVRCDAAYLMDASLPPSRRYRENLPPRSGQPLSHPRTSQASLPRPCAPGTTDEWETVLGWYAYCLYSPAMSITLPTIPTYTRPRCGGKRKKSSRLGGFVAARSTLITEPMEVAESAKTLVICPDAFVHDKPKEALPAPKL